jgi:hypothetical protein
MLELLWRPLKIRKQWRGADLKGIVLVLEAI